MTGSGALSGKRVLLVEDEFYIASDMHRALAEQDAIVVGPVSNVAAGLALAETAAIDLAVLDINLRGEMSFCIADRLSERRVPFALSTGYDQWALPERFKDCPRLAKPFATAALIQTLDDLAGGGGTER